MGGGRGGEGGGSGGSLELSRSFLEKLTYLSL